MYRSIFMFSTNFTAHWHKFIHIHTWYKESDWENTPIFTFPPEAAL